MTVDCWHSFCMTVGLTHKLAVVCTGLDFTLRLACVCVSLLLLF